MNELSTVSKNLFQLLWGVHKFDKHGGFSQGVHHPLSLSAIVRKDGMSQLTYHLFTLHTPTTILELTGREPPQREFISASKFLGLT